MIRKKNKNVVDTEKNNAELKAREEELRRIQEEREQRKAKQIELTNNLKKTYSHIRPTIIQGQRILKIIEGFEERVRLLQVFSSRNLQAMKPAELQISAEIKDLLEQFKKHEIEYSALKDEISAKKKEFDAYAEDDEEPNEQTANLVADSEQEKIYLQLKEKEEEISVLSEKYKKKIRQALRLLDEDNSSYQSILAAAVPVTESSTEDSILKSCYEIVASLKFVFLKKLSTGFDEQETHKSLMERLNANIKENKQLLKNKESELQSIVEERANTNAEKNKEINDWKDKLVEMKQKEEERSRLLVEENIFKRQKTKQTHDEREARLKEAIAKAIKDLEEQEKKNSEEEGALTKMIDEYKTRLYNYTQEYETQIRDRKVSLAETQVIWTAWIRLDFGEYSGSWGGV